MSSPEKRPLERGREEVRAARALLEAGFPSQAVSHAFMAGFQAATAALYTIGEAPATRTGALSSFSRHVVGDDGVDHEDGRILRKLFEDRSYVDHLWARLPSGRHRPPSRARSAWSTPPLAGSSGAPS